MNTELPITELPDGSGCFTATIMSNEEAMALPLKDRPLNYRLSSEIYHAVFESIGAASMCWQPKPTGVFDSTAAEKVAVELCFKIADENEKELTRLRADRDALLVYLKKHRANVAECVRVMDGLFPAQANDPLDPAAITLAEIDGILAAIAAAGEGKV